VRTSSSCRMCWHQRSSVTKNASVQGDTAAATCHSGCNKPSADKEAAHVSSGTYVQVVILAQNDLAPRALTCALADVSSNVFQALQASSRSLTGEVMVDFGVA
jgi:hypothetical protein